MNNIGERIKSYRKKAGMSQQELANKVSVSRSTIASYENGNIKPSVDVAFKLNEIFNAPILELLLEEGVELTNRDFIDLRLELNKLIASIEHHQVKYGNSILNGEMQKHIVECLNLTKDTAEVLIKVSKNRRPISKNVTVKAEG